MMKNENKCYYAHTAHNAQTSRTVLGHNIVHQSGLTKFDSIRQLRSTHTAARVITSTAGIADDTVAVADDIAAKVSAHNPAICEFDAPMVGERAWVSSQQYRWAHELLRP